MQTWNIDPAHSTVGFKVKHLMVSTVRGRFNDFEGQFSVDDDQFTNPKVTFKAKATSIDTGVEMRDNHLRSADFFEVEKYPEITFVSTGGERKGDAYELVGDFTLHGVTKPVTLTVTTEGIGKGMNGETVAGFDLTGSINRSEFGLTWNAALEAGGVTVSDKVVFDIHIEAKHA